MTFARRVFLIAGVYGLLVLVPQYFLEGRAGRGIPGGIVHPEYYYGFIGVAVAWQIVFLLISRDPIRYRPIMIAGMVEKVTFGVAAVALYLRGRLNTELLGAGALDLILLVLFIIAYLRTADAAREAARPTQGA